METIVKTDPVIEDQKTSGTDAVVTESKPGEKTDPALLLESLQKERQKRKDAEDELAALKATPPPTVDVYSDEGKVLLDKISVVEAELHSAKQKEILTDLQTTYPALKDKYDEFQTFVSDPENKGMKLETAAKAFLAEHNLLETGSPRKGLEPVSGGGRTPSTGGMTAAEVDDLRNTNYRKYSDMVRKGQIKITG